MVPRSEILRAYSNFDIKYLRKVGPDLPGPQDFSIAATNPDLAKQIHDPIANSVSVELAYGQGLTSYSFVVPQTFGLELPRAGKSRRKAQCPNPSRCIIGPIVDQLPPDSEAANELRQMGCDFYATNFFLKLWSLWDQKTLGKRTWEPRNRNARSTFAIFCTIN